MGLSGKTVLLFGGFLYFSPFIMRNYIDLSTVKKVINIEFEFSVSCLVFEEEQSCE